MPPAWTSGYIQPPRRSHEQPPSEVQSGRTSTSDEIREPRRRTSSDSTPRQPSASTRFLSTTTDQDTNRDVLGTEGWATSKRLGLLADKISSSLSGGCSGANLRVSVSSSQLLHPHSHTKADSASTSSPSISPSSSLMNASSTTINIPKAHSSPSKVSFLFHRPIITNSIIFRALMAAPTTPNSSVAKCTGWRLSSHPALPCPWCHPGTYLSSVLHPPTPKTHGVYCMSMSSLFSMESHSGYPCECLWRQSRTHCSLSCSQRRPECPC